MGALKGKVICLRPDSQLVAELGAAPSSPDASVLVQTSKWALKVKVNPMFSEADSSLG